MLKKGLIILFFFPLYAMAQYNKEKKCKDIKRGIDELPCKFVNRYAIDVIPDEETAIKYTNILVNKRDLLNPEEVKPYQISLTANNKVWHIAVKSNKCIYCKIYININKNTGEVLNHYKSGD